MAEKQISILLVAKNLASGAIGKVTKDVTTLGKVSNRAGQGMRSLAGNLAKIGAAAAVGIGIAVKTGIDNLVQLEDGITSVTAALATMGLAGKVTAANVAAWANEIESSVGYAFDDKAILAASETLIRYGKVSESNLQPAMVVMTDLAAKTGDVESAATLLGKALADPEKAAGKLAKQGVILTKAQQAQIKAMMKAGDVAGAQKVILDSLATTTKGAAKASQGPYKEAMSTLKEVTEEATMALATGFLPVIQKAALWLGQKLADPKVIADIKSFGNSLAGGFDKALSFAQSIDWNSVRSAAAAIGTGAKMMLDAFLAMPAWVQTAVVGGWGLNKLTGGALGDIVGELGKGLIKGVLGMNAAVVNINAGVVNGGGGGLPGKGGGVGDVAGTVAKGGALATAGAAGVVTAGALAGMYALLYGLPAIAAAQPGFKPEKGVNAESARDPGFQANRQIAALLAGVPKIASNTAQSLTGDRSTRSQLTGVKSAALESARAIRAKKWDVDVGVKVTVPVRTTVSVRQFNIVAKTQGAYQGSAMIRVRGAG